MLTPLNCTVAPGMPPPATPRPTSTIGGLLVLKLAAVL
jgi:hypothetical protein